MAYQRGRRVIPRKSNTKFICGMLEENSDVLHQHSNSPNMRKWVIFGGFVRDKIMGLNHQDNDIDIGVIGESAGIIIKKLENQDRLRIDDGIEESPTNTIYPVRRIVADLPEFQTSIDFVNMAHPMFKICDFTINNLMYVNTTMDINVRVNIEGKTKHETLALSMNDIHHGLLRFMMPTEIPCSCRRHYIQTPRPNRVAPYSDFTSNFSKSCTQCALVFLEQQLKLVERLNKMLNKKHHETGEKLFRLADEPNFPPYFPKIVEKEEIQDNEMCPICQEAFHQCGDTVITTCGHKYCADCMYNHVMTSTQRSEFGRRDSVSCPMCREKVVLQTLGDLQVSSEAAEEGSSVQVDLVDWE
jgi:hypothetical protein